VNIEANLCLRFHSCRLAPYPNIKSFPFPVQRHVTTAGTVGTFWFSPEEANGCCSKAVRDSYFRSLTTSFGSICFGSLIVALIQAVKSLVHSMRENGSGFVACCADCILGCIESLVEYFNKWAYVYVGLYGFSFMEAGSNVMTLFRSRGWSVIVADMMVDTVLFFVGVGVGVLTALFTALIGYLVNSQTDAGTLNVIAFTGFLFGYSMSMTLFSIVSSAVNTVIVCYAEAPSEFQINHPQLSDRMRNAWQQAYPSEFGY
jgi:Plasma-membrane choline transporter